MKRGRKILIAIGITIAAFILLLLLFGGTFLYAGPFRGLIIR
jgi:hypothetical protein